MPRKKAETGKGKEIASAKTLPKNFITRHNQISVWIGNNEYTTLKVGHNNVYDEEISAMILAHPTIQHLIDIDSVIVEYNYVDGSDNSLGIEVKDSNVGDEMPINDLDLDSPKLKAELREGENAGEVKEEIKKKATETK